MSIGNFHEEDTPSKLMMHIHALVLKLLTNGFITFKVKDKSKIGMQTISLDDLLMTLTHTKTTHANNTSVMLHEYLVSENWVYINTYGAV